MDMSKKTNYRDAILNGDPKYLRSDEYHYTKDEIDEQIEDNPEMNESDIEDYIIKQIQEIIDDSEGDYGGITLDGSYLAYRDVYMECIKKEIESRKDSEYISSKMFKFYESIRRILDFINENVDDVHYSDYRNMYEGYKDLIKELSNDKELTEKIIEDFEKEYYDSEYPMEDKNCPEHAEVRKIIEEFEDGDYSKVDDLAKYTDFIELDDPEGDWSYLLELLDGEDRKKFCKILLKAGIDEEKVSDYIDEEIEELDSDEISPEIEEKIEQIHEHQEELSQKEKELQELEDKEKEKRKEGKNYGE